MTRRSYQIAAEHARNERWKTISVRLTEAEYKALLLVVARHEMTPAGYVRRQIRDAIGKP